MKGKKGAQLFQAGVLPNFVSTNTAAYKAVHRSSAHECISEIVDASKITYFYDTVRASTNNST